jgi:hypothetical protein
MTTITKGTNNKASKKRKVSCKIKIVNEVSKCWQDILCYYVFSGIYYSQKQMSASQQEANAELYYKKEVDNFEKQRGIWETVEEYILPAINTVQVTSDDGAVKAYHPLLISKSTNAITGKQIVRKATPVSFTDLLPNLSYMKHSYCAYLPFLISFTAGSNDTICLSLKAPGNPTVKLRISLR